MKTGNMTTADLQAAYAAAWSEWQATDNPDTAVRASRECRAYRTEMRKRDAVAAIRKFRETACNA